MKTFLLFLLFFVYINADDICYEKPYIDNSQIFFLNIKNRRVIPIKSLSNNLKNVSIQYASEGFPYYNIGIDKYPKSKDIDNPDEYIAKGITRSECFLNNGEFINNNCKRIDQIYRGNTDISIDPNGKFITNDTIFKPFEHGLEYNIGNLNKNDIHKIWFENILSHKKRIYAKYYKKNIFYYVNINPCGKEVPDIYNSDSFLQKPKKNTYMIFNIKVLGKLESNITKDNISYIHYHTEPYTAKPFLDYIPVKGILSIPKNKKEVFVKVLIKGNSHVGKFYLILDNAYGARIKKKLGVGNILYISLRNKLSSYFWGGIGIKNSFNNVNNNTNKIKRKRLRIFNLYNRLEW